jgi:hypothetical protein
MQFPSSFGTANLILNDALMTLPYRVEPDGRSFSLLPTNDLRIALPDYEPRFDVYYHSNSDGDCFYDAVHVLPDERDLDAPSKIEPAALKSMAEPYIQRLADDVYSQLMEGADLIFAIRTLNSPTWMHAAWVKAGYNIDAALQNVMREVFHC